jgi:hypothetical protein
MTCTGQTDPCTKRSIGGRRVPAKLCNSRATGLLYHPPVRTTRELCDIWSAGGRCAGGVLLGALIAGCASPPGGLDSAVPVERLNAIARVAREKDQAAVPKLITFLNSDDPIVRLSSIRTLEALTGQTLGYDHAAPEWQRRGMVETWVEWYNRSGRPIVAEPDGGNGGARAKTRPEPGNADTVR